MLAEAAGKPGFDGALSAAVGRLMADRFLVKPDIEGMNLGNERLSLASSIVGELSDILGASRRCSSSTISRWRTSYPYSCSRTWRGTSRA